MFLLLAACAAGSPARPSPPRDLDVAAQPHAAPPVDAIPPIPVVVPAPTPAPVLAPAPVVQAAPDPDTLARLAWPATTTSFVLRRPSHVFATPDPSSEPLGKIIDGTRIPVGASTAGDRRCKVWLAVAPRGWICARDAKPSPRPPAALDQPPVPEGQLLPHAYFGLQKGAKRYATEDDVRAGIARPEPKVLSTYMVTKDDKAPNVEIDGVTYAHTSVGLVAVGDLRRYAPSTFAGVDLVTTPPPAWPFAWVIAPGRRPVVARATAEKKGAEAGTFAHRAIVPVLEEAAGFVRVGDGQWIERARLRIARMRPRPDVAGAHARWLDLDRDEQVMVAYEGDTPVFATLFSSGRSKKDTPPALYRIRSKTAVTRMAAEEREASHYEVSEVPWATRFRSGLYFHAAYWHDEFGTARSHGCVNLSPRDARWVYAWTAPSMPAGWNELEVPVAGAMVVRVYDAAHPDPSVFDYEREARERVKIRKREKELKAEREAAEAAAADGTAVPLTP